MTIFYSNYFFLHVDEYIFGIEVADCLVDSGWDGWTILSWYSKCAIKTKNWREFPRELLYTLSIKENTASRFQSNLLGYFYEVKAYHHEEVFKFGHLLEWWKIIYKE